MGGWSKINGPAVALDQANIDTDQLIPARFMSQPRAAGYGKFLLHDARQDDADHVLNRHKDARVLVTRRNFGSGSSREAAVYALVDFGVQAVFAPSFGDIFSANAVNNGLLPARLDETVIAELTDRIGGKAVEAQIDLSSRSAVIGGQKIIFDLDETWAQKLINGWDDIDITKAHAETIKDFRNTYFGARPWAMPRGQTGA